MRQIFVVLAFVSVSFTARAHDVISTKVTWTREISRIIFDHCVSCHRENGSAFSLTTYQAARPWAKAIKEETLERRMPPFGAVKGFSDLKDDQSLMQEQLELISDWVEGVRLKATPDCFQKLPLWLLPSQMRLRMARRSSLSATQSCVSRQL